MYRTEVLDEYLAGRDVRHESLAVLERLFGGRVKKANAVKVANLGLLGNGLFHILKGRARGHVDAGGEALDGLLRRCSGGKGARLAGGATRSDGRQEPCQGERTAVGELERGRGRHCVCAVLVQE